MIVRFWEARICDGRLPEALEWVRRDVLPIALAAGANGAEVVHAEADGPTGQPARVVVMTRWSFDPEFVEAEADPAIVERSHAWNFNAG